MLDATGKGGKPLRSRNTQPRATSGSEAANPNEIMLTKAQLMGHTRASRNQGKDNSRFYSEVGVVWRRLGFTY